jgi:hypothetical protein
LAATGVDIIASQNTRVLRRSREAAVFAIVEKPPNKIGHGTVGVSIHTFAGFPPDDLADALAFALRFEGRKWKHDAAEFIAQIVAKRLISRPSGALGFVVMKTPPIGGSTRLGRGHKSDNAAMA